MTEYGFTTRRDKFWREFAEALGNPRLMRADRFPQDFREISQDLNTARAHGFDPALIERLNRMVLEGHQRLYDHRSFSPRPLLHFAAWTFPRTVRAHRWGIGAACLVFYGLALFFTLFCFRFPEASYRILPESQIKSLEEMYSPESPHFLSPRGLSGDADMFGFYIYNNVSIAFRTFAGGILGGLGSLFFLAYNALALGTAAGYLVNRGLAETFFSFIIGHSSFELTALVFSAYAGLLMGYRFFIPAGLSRGASIKRAGREALPIIAGAALLLVIAAVIEAFWSSRFQIETGVRFAAGGLGWAALILYFTLAGRGAEGKGGKTAGERP
ncbi:MAG: stage II sporulation protein M [Treponema sp.]|jgi:uncharacterized membrane protein SpoIIM required for sporulation|nr:stage II sporulation protein M [Treponema sp.]